MKKIDSHCLRLMSLWTSTCAYHYLLINHFTARNNFVATQFITQKNRHYLYKHNLFVHIQKHNEKEEKLTCWANFKMLSFFLFYSFHFATLLAS